MKACAVFLLTLVACGGGASEGVEIGPAPDAHASLDHDAGMSPPPVKVVSAAVEDAGSLMAAPDAVTASDAGSLVTVDAWTAPDAATAVPPVSVTCGYSTAGNSESGGIVGFCSCSPGTPEYATVPADVLPSQSITGLPACPTFVGYPRPECQIYDAGVLGCVYYGLDGGA
jgi:hypothetical protein